MKRKTALITGVTGQDGAYLAELLLAKGYEVHGMKRRSSLLNTERVDHLYEDPHLDHRNFVLHYGDLTDSMNVTRLIQEVQPDEIYNLGAMSHVRVSFDMPEYTANVDGIGTLRVLEAVRLLGLTEIKEQLRQNPLLKMGEIQWQSGDYAWAITQTFSKNAKAGFDTETGSDIALGKQLILHQLSVELEREPHEFVYITWQ